MGKEKALVDEILGKFFKPASLHAICGKRKRLQNFPRLVFLEVLLI
jgi:hypothetical protein